MVVAEVATVYCLLLPFAGLELFDAPFRFGLLGVARSLVGRDVRTIVPSNPATILAHLGVSGPPVCLIRLFVINTGFPQCLIYVLAAGFCRGDDLFSLLEPQPASTVELRGAGDARELGWRAFAAGDARVSSFSKRSYLLHVAAPRIAGRLILPVGRHASFDHGGCRD